MKFLFRIDKGKVGNDLFHHFELLLKRDGLYISYNYRKGFKKEIQELK